METLRPKAAATVLAIRLEKPGSLKWRAGHYLVLEGNAPRTMKPAELERDYERADVAAQVRPVVAASTRKAPGGRGAPKRVKKTVRAKAPSIVRVPAPVPGRPGRRSAFSAEQMGEARRLIVDEGKSIAEAAKELDITYQVVWRWSKTNGWETK